jgi:hypothetical protein
MSIVRITTVVLNSQQAADAAANPDIVSIEAVVGGVKLNHIN